VVVGCREGEDKIGERRRERREKKGEERGEKRGEVKGKERRVGREGLGVGKIGRKGMKWVERWGEDKMVSTGEEEDGGRWKIIN
jgi:hypothetical protein